MSNVGLQFKSYVFTSSEFRYDSLENETWFYLNESLRYFLETGYIKQGLIYCQLKHVAVLWNETNFVMNIEVRWMSNFSSAFVFLSI